MLKKCLRYKSPGPKLMCVHLNAGYYLSVWILLVLFVVSIVLCVCVRLLVIVAFIHDIIHWVHTHINIIG